MAEKFATSAEVASACRVKFMVAHGIVQTEKKTQKRNDWSVNGSSARALGTIEDLIYMWYNMDMSLPIASYQHANMSLPSRHHPLPYLPEALRVKLYPSLAVNGAGIRELCRVLGAMPPHPKFNVDFQGRAVELSMSIKFQTQSCRRVSIEVWRKYLDEKKSSKERLRAEDLETDVVRGIRSRVHSELQPAYMRPQPTVNTMPVAHNLRDTSLRAHKLDYGNHDADPGIYKYKKTISGTVTRDTLVTLFEQAEMGQDSIFLDIGSGLSEPMIVAATGFQVQLSLGFEVHKSRLEQGLRSIIEKGASRAFPIHVSVEEICHFDPVTHVYCYSNGMDSCARNCIRESVLSSESVQFVMTDRKNLLNYPDEESQFEQVAAVPMKMAGAKGKKRMFYVLRRTCKQRINTGTVRFHAIFALPLYTLRFDRNLEQAFLIEYLKMLSRVEYKPLYFCSMKIPAAAPTGIKACARKAEAHDYPTPKRKK